MKYQEEFAKLLDMDDTADRARFIEEMKEKLIADEAQLKTAETLLEETRGEFNKLHEDYADLRKEYVNQYMLKGNGSDDADQIFASEFEGEFTAEDAENLFN